MKNVIYLLLLLYTTASAQFMATTGAGGIVDGDGYFHVNGFETQADDDDWTPGANAPDFDNAFSIKGSECMELTGNPNEAASIAVTARAETWVTFMMRTNDNNENTENFFLLYNNSTLLGTLLYDGDNKMKVQADGGTLSGFEAVSVSTAIQYIKLRYKQGTGVNAELEFWASTDGTNWAKNLSSTDGTAILQLDKITIQNTHDTEVMRIDNFIEHSADITDAR